MTTLAVAALYRFTRLEDPAALRPGVEAGLRAAGVTGTILLAREGVNGTIAGSARGIAAAMAALRRLPGCADLGVRESRAEAPPFRRLKVRVKREIVSFGVPEADPVVRSRTRVAPGDWNALLARPDLVLIDARNGYETGIGSFRGAIQPGTARFRDFPGWWQANRDSFRGRPVAMFCTGGIRCEKTTSLAAADPGAEVYHLSGGILAYLETVPPGESLWQGECFVFDGRVALTHGLGEGSHTVCHACRAPVTPEGRQSPDWVPGISCPACAGVRSDADRARFAERMRQAALAEARSGQAATARGADPSRTGR